MRTAAKIFCGIVSALFATSAMAVTVEQRKALCLTDPVGHSWVEETGACIEAVPCASQDKIVRDTYCIESVKDIPLDVNLPASYNDTDNNAFVAYGLDGGCAVVSGIDGGFADMKYDMSICNKKELKKGDWNLHFWYGEIKGTSMCGTLQVNAYGEGWQNSQLDLITDAGQINEKSGDKQFCWCKVETFIQPVSASVNWDYVKKNYHPVDTAKWLSIKIDNATQARCNAMCAFTCANAFARERDFRYVSIFGESPL